MGLFQSKPESECCKPEEISKHEECLKEKLLSNEAEELVKQESECRLKEGSTPTYTEEFKSADNEDAKSTEILEATYTEEIKSTEIIEPSYTVDNIVSDDICVEDFDSSILTKPTEESNHVEEEVNNVEEPDITEETKKKKKTKRNKKQVTTV